MADNEVARFRLPMAVRGMDKLVDSLEQSYGKGLFMHQEDDWLIVTRGPRETPDGTG